MKPLLKTYGLYLLRWQLSTPILAVCVALWVAPLGATGATVAANLIGGIIFFWIDRWIFHHTDLLYGELWEVRADVTCADCGAPVARGYRLAKAAKFGYDKTADPAPEFRCHDCSRQKYAAFAAAAGGQDAPGGSQAERPLHQRR